MIKLNDIVVKFDDFTALHNINVHVKEGEFFGRKQAPQIETEKQQHRKADPDRAVCHSAVCIYLQRL